MKKLLVLALLLVSASIVYAQSPVTTSPKGVINVNASGQISVTSTFQSVFAASSVSSGRLGCTLQNRGSNTMYVFFGPIATATISASVAITSAQTIYCGFGGVVLKDQVSITGTSGDFFYASQY